MMERLQKKFSMIAAMCLCIMAAFSSCVNDDDPENTGVGVGDRLPEFKVTLSDNSTVSTQSLKGKVAAIEFFNTSCEDCRRSFPEFQKAYDSFSTNPDVVFVAIAREEDYSSIRQYWDSNNLSIPFAPETGRSCYNLFATVGIPRLYIADRNGIIVAAFGPEDYPSAGSITELIEKLIVR